MQVVRYKSAKNVFEVGTKKGAVLAFKRGEVGFDQVLESENVSLSL